MAISETIFLWTRPLSRKDSQGLRAEYCIVGIPYNTAIWFHLNLLIILGVVLKTSYFFLNIMHKVKAQRSGELFVKNMLILQHHFAVLDLETGD